MLTINIGMPRSGTLWRYKLIRDLVIAGGGTDGVEIRKKYLLHPFVSGLNADINTLSSKRLLPAAIPSFLGESYVLNTHSSPRPIMNWLLKNNHARAIYGYRDPRDCILSILEYSRRAKPEYSNVFLTIKTVSQAVDFIQLYLHIYDQWLDAPGTLILRYETMLEEYDKTINQIIQHLGLKINQDKLDEVAARYLPQQKSRAGEQTHFEYGIAHRFRQEFNQDELDYLAEKLGPYLEKMGYPI